MSACLRPSDGEVCGGARHATRGKRESIGLGFAIPIDVAKPSFWCDVAQALHFLEAGGIDTTASVVNAVNVLLDLVRATGIEIEDRRRKALYSIADYCTISKDLTRYLEEVGDYSSVELVDAVLWCVGAPGELRVAPAAGDHQLGVAMAGRF